MNNDDTIAAICSGVGGSISMFRISGPNAIDIANAVWQGKNKLSIENSKKMLLGNFSNINHKSKEKIFAVYMNGPQTFTGEDTVELYAHGGGMNAKRILSALFQAGARQAQPGEFSYRAFLNGKIDLTQAEGICDLINANSEIAINLAEKQIEGALGKKIRHIKDALYGIMMECEAFIDFPEETLKLTSPSEVVKVLEFSLSELNKIYQTKEDGHIIREGVRISIVGKPNTGKSSLMNSLLGYNRAIITDIAGTTRDTLEELVSIRQIPIKLIDTAGIRKTEDIIESEGISRTLRAITNAQIVLYLLDAASSAIVEDINEMKKMIPSNKEVIVVLNKIDLIKNDKVEYDIKKLNGVEISIKTSYGIENLIDKIEQKVWGHSVNDEIEIAISNRHIPFIKTAIEMIPKAIENIENNDMELASCEIKNIIVNLSKILGEDQGIDIYDSIFSKFCIGK